MLNEPSRRHKMKKLHKKVIDKIKETLINQKKELQSKSYHTEIDMEGDETDEIQGKIIALVNNKISSRDKQKLQQINNALKKIDEKTFGTCEGCGEMIAEKRLEFNPYFSMCIDCSEELEKESKRKIAQ